jgi:hypothetical protein
MTITCVIQGWRKTYNNKQFQQKSKEKDVEDNARRPLPLFHKEKKVPLQTNMYYQILFAWKSHNGIEQLKC